MTTTPDLDAIEKKLADFVWPAEFRELLEYSRAQQQRIAELERQLDEADKANVQRRANHLVAAGDCGPSTYEPEPTERTKCSFPDCGCAEARLCMFPPANDGAMAWNLPKRKEPNQ